MRHEFDLSASLDKLWMIQKPMSSFMAPSPILSISALNQSVSDLLNASLPPVWVVGEISNLMRAQSGHWYFVLKDTGAQVRCVMFKQKNQYVGLKLDNGSQVEAYVQIGLYAPRGEYQLTVESLRLAGRGRLFEAFEERKAKLEAEGLFAPHRKRALPVFPRTVGIVTSLQAAALRDVLTTLQRRAPHLALRLYPTPVQGPEAPPGILAALQRAAGDALDALLLVRGGGSMEDLWAFNDESVARALAVFPVPVVCGVGHETDFTLADFVADVRAPTPTAAAELVALPTQDWLRRLDTLASRLDRRWQQQQAHRSQQVDYAARRLVHPGTQLARQQQALRALSARMQAAFTHQHRYRCQQLSHLQLRHAAAPPIPMRAQALVLDLQRRHAAALTRTLRGHHHQLAQLATRLHAMDPSAVLARGYSLVTTASGHILRSPTQVRAGEVLSIQAAAGNITATVAAPPPLQQDLGL